MAENEIRAIESTNKKEWNYLLGEHYDRWMKLGTMKVLGYWNEKIKDGESIIRLEWNQSNRKY